MTSHAAARWIFEYPDGSRAVVDADGNVLPAATRALREREADLKAWADRMTLYNRLTMAPPRMGIDVGYHLAAMRGKEQVAQGYVGLSYAAAFRRLLQQVAHISGRPAPFATAFETYDANYPPRVPAAECALALEWLAAAAESIPIDQDDRVYMALRHDVNGGVYPTIRAGLAEVVEGVREALEAGARYDGVDLI